MFDDISSLLSGFPDQAMFAVDLLRDGTTQRIEDNIPLIADFNSDKASILLAKYENNEEMLDFIRLLAQFEVITSDFIFSLVSEEKYYPLLERLAADHIVELIGIDGEIIRLNDMVRDYVKRNRIKLNSTHALNIQSQVKITIESDDIFEIDSSEYIFSLKEALKNNLSISDKFLIPSHYLRCMKDLYHGRGSLDRTIELADIILQKEASLEYRVLQDIRYYLCLALARKRDGRMLKEVQNIKGDEHTFLLGYYYRLCGRLRDALEKFEIIVNARFVSDRAKREIVQVYVQLEEYEKALDYARNNYEHNRGNQFHTQAYFNVLVNSSNARDNKKVLLSLISDLRNINSEQSIEMAGISEALYFAKAEGKQVQSLDKINDCVNAMPDSHYPLLALCDLAIKYKDVDLLESGVSRLIGMKKKQRVSPATLNRYQSYLHALKGDLGSAIGVIKRDLERFPEGSKDRLIAKLSEIADIASS